MDKISGRIKELIDNSGLSNKEFAERIDVSPAIISHILSGRNKPSLHVIQQITNVYTNVNLNYLLSGEGTLYRQKPSLEATKPKADKQSEAFNLNDAVRPVAPPDSTPLHSSVGKGPADLAAKAPEKQELNPEEEIGKTNVNLNNIQKYTKDARAEKEIERVIIFYSDKTMEEYRP